VKEGFRKWKGRRWRVNRDEEWIRERLRREAKGRVNKHDRMDKGKIKGRK
jgi:hypothetical protein